jgi:hypothetical protein
MSTFTLYTPLDASTLISDILFKMESIHFIK